MTKSASKLPVVSRDWKITIEPSNVAKPKALVGRVGESLAMFDNGTWVSVAATNPSSGRQALREYLRLSSVNDLRDALGDLRVVVPGKNGVTIPLREIVEALHEIQCEEAGIGSSD